jgi:glutathione S-transferase
MAAATLHRCPVPTDRLCPCGKVARELRSAGIEFDEVREPLRKSARDQVIELTGQNRVPVLVIGDEAICDSHRIVEWIAEQRPATPAA